MRRWWLNTGSESEVAVVDLAGDVVDVFAGDVAGEVADIFGY